MQYSLSYRSHFYHKAALRLEYIPLLHRQYLARQSESSTEKTHIMMVLYQAGKSIVPLTQLESLETGAANENFLPSVLDWGKS